MEFLTENEEEVDVVSIVKPTNLNSNDVKCCFDWILTSNIINKRGYIIDNDKEIIEKNNLNIVKIIIGWGEDLHLYHINSIIKRKSKSLLLRGDDHDDIIKKGSYQLIFQKKIKLKDEYISGLFWINEKICMAIKYDKPLLNIVGKNKRKMEKEKKMKKGESSINIRIVSKVPNIGLIDFKDEEFTMLTDKEYKRIEFIKSSSSTYDIIFSSNVSFLNSNEIFYCFENEFRVLSILPWGERIEYKFQPGKMDDPNEAFMMGKNLLNGVEKFVVGAHPDIERMKFEVINVLSNLLTVSFETYLKRNIQSKINQEEEDKPELKLEGFKTFEKLKEYLILCLDINKEDLFFSKILQIVDKVVDDKMKLRKFVLNEIRDKESEIKSLPFEFVKKQIAIDSENNSNDFIDLLLNQLDKLEKLGEESLLHVIEYLRKKKSFLYLVPFYMVIYRKQRGSIIELFKFLLIENEKTKLKWTERVDAFYTLLGYKELLIKRDVFKFIRINLKEILFCFCVNEDAEDESFIRNNVKKIFEWIFKYIERNDVDEKVVKEIIDLIHDINDSEISSDVFKFEYVKFLMTLYTSEKIEYGESGSGLPKLKEIRITPVEILFYVMDKIVNKEDSKIELIKKYLKFVTEKEPQMLSQKNIHELFALSENKKIKSLESIFRYKMKGKQGEVLKSMITKLKQEDISYFEMITDISLIIEESDLKWFYDQLFLIFPTKQGNHKIEIGVYIYKFISELLKLCGDNPGDYMQKLAKKNIIFDKKFHENYVYIVAFLYERCVDKSGKEEYLTAIVDYLKLVDMDVNLKNLIKICDKIPKIKMFLYSRFEIVDQLSREVTEFLKKKLSVLKDKLIVQADEFEKNEWRKKIKSIQNDDFMREYSKVLNVFDLYLDFKDVHKNNLNNDRPKMPIFQTLEFFNTNIIRQIKPEDKRTWKKLRKISEESGGNKRDIKKDLHLNDFSFNKFSNELPPKPFQTPFEDFHPAVEKIDLPKITDENDHYSDVLQITEHLNLVKEIDEIVQNYLSYPSESSKLKKKRINEMWLDILNFTFVNDLICLRDGFIDLNIGLFKDNDKEIEEKAEKELEILSLTDKIGKREYEKNKKVINKEIKELTDKKNEIMDEKEDSSEEKKIQLNRYIDRYDKQIRRLFKKLKRLDRKKEKMKEQKIHRLQDESDPKNMNKLTNLWLQRCIYEFITLLIDKMHKFVSIPTIVSSLISSFDKKRFHQIKHLCSKYMLLYEYNLILLKEANELLAFDRYRACQKIYENKRTGIKNSIISKCCSNSCKMGSGGDIKPLNNENLKLFVDCSHIYHAECVINDECELCVDNES